MTGQWIADDRWKCWFKKPKEKNSKYILQVKNEGTWTKRNHLVLGRKIHSDEWRQRRSHWNGSRDSCDMWRVCWEPKSPWLVSSSVPQGLSALLLPASLLLSLCIVSDHFIPIYTQDHLSRKKGFSIWMQDILRNSGSGVQPAVARDWSQKLWKSARTELFLLSPPSESVPCLCYCLYFLFLPSPLTPILTTLTSS